MAEQLVVFDSNLMLWQSHPTVPDLMLKIFESRATGRGYDAVLVKVLTGNKIDWHSHAEANETIYVIQGVGEILGANGEQHQASAGPIKLARGSVVTIPVALRHAVFNTGSEPLLIFAFHSRATV